MVHGLGALLYQPVLVRALANESLFDSSPIDTLPKIVQTGLGLGRHFPAAVLVPDIDRTQQLGRRREPDDLARQPDDDARRSPPPRGVLERGGKLVAVDPRRIETAKLASEHHFSAGQAAEANSATRLCCSQGIPLPGRAVRACYRNRGLGAPGS
jgi:hypothetical protein